MKNWFTDQTWEKVYQLDSAHDKADKFQEILLQALDNIFPQKVRAACVRCHGTKCPLLTAGFFFSLSPPGLPFSQKGLS